MVTKDKNPSPMNSGEPQGSGRGALIVGQSWKMPEVGRLEQSFEPPPQFGIPDEPKPTLRLPDRRHPTIGILDRSSEPLQPLRSRKDVGDFESGDESI